MRLRVRWAVLAVLLAALTGGALAAAQPVPDAPPVPSEPTDEATLSPEDRARRAKVIAKVADRTITVGEVEDAINAQSPFLRKRYEDPVRKREFVNTMIRFELLALGARKRGYDEHNRVVESRKRNAVQQLIRREFDEKLTAASIPEEDVRKYFDEHPDEFRRPEMLRAAHILVGSREEADKLLEEAKGADVRAFRQLAREHSIDTETKHRGGDLRYFTKQGTPPGSPDAHVAEVLVEAAFQLAEVGDVAAEPIPVGNAFSILKLTGRRPAESRPYEQAEQGIRLRLWRERRQKAIEDFVVSLRERFSPKIFPERMAPIRLDTGGTPEGLQKAEKGEKPAGSEGSPEKGEKGAKAESPEGDGHGSH